MPHADFSKPYDPKEHELKTYELWEESGFFNPDNLPHRRVGLPVNKNLKLKIKNYIVYMPLPNVTGTLHMGHALDNTFQDIAVRYHRMRGFRTLWLPGTDHAGIATQYVVEKQLRKEGTSRFDLGREKFIERVWEWKKEYGGKILDQLRKIGVSADWSRTRFTMDPAYAKDVRDAFVHYYHKKLIYRGERVVNWCPRCGTSLSELELEYEDENGALYYITYGPFILATVRPETKFGDTALAVNPRDRRYKKFIGKELEFETLSTEGDLEHPALRKTKVRVVGDEAVDPKFGTGVIKVTPAHDMTDYEIGVRHKLSMVQVIDERGKMNANAGKYAGMKTEDARKKVVEDLKTLGLLVKEEFYLHRVSKCYRCGHVIEPLPSMQWFLKMPGLAKKAIAAVKTKKVSITPKNFEKLYFNWLGNIRDWAISRQIWWGHRLPVWFCKTKQEEFSISNSQFSNSSQDSKFVVAVEKPKICPFCKNCEMEQSADVLDTWFSSALWPFAGLSAPDVKKYYPGNTLITARDILNLWVARMIFSGLEFKGKVPLEDVLIHGTVLAKDGRRMSKSLGTGVDPLRYVEQYGADAMRFGIVWQAIGQDIKWDEAAVVAGRKFTNKIWNAARFVLAQTENSKFQISNFKLTPKTQADKKILTSLQKTKKQTEEYIETFQFAKALRGLYDFFWHDFCDAYLEASKQQLADEKLKQATQQVLVYALRESLKMLHPFLPFITETIYQEFHKGPNSLLLIEEW